MKCNHCDKTIPEGSSFCPYCGSRIGVPDSLKCPICNLDVPIGTSFCPNCGSPIGVSKSPVCGKCGTVLQKGDKFCPNCGSPIGITQSTDFNQSWNEQSGKQGANHGFASKAEELYQQSKKYINEKVQPQFDERINEFKSVDWSEKKSESVSFLKGFFSNTDKLRKVTLWIAVISVLWFFIFNDGFSASWMWWALALMVIGAAFYKAKSLNEARKLFAATLFFALCFFVYSPSDKSFLGISDEELYKNSSMQIPSWLTEWKFVCETESGGKIIVKLNNNGTAIMTLADQTGAHLRGYYNGNAVDMKYNGTYTVEGNYVYLSFAGMSKRIALEMDVERQRLYGEGGGVFKQSAF